MSGVIHPVVSLPMRRLAIDEDIRRPLIVRTGICTGMAGAFVTLSSRWLTHQSPPLPHQSHVRWFGFHDASSQVCITLHVY
jgi:hypothetical protein